MSANLPSSFSFLASQTPRDFIGLGVVQLPKRNFFQSISDFFAARSGNQRISFFLLGAHEIKVVHYQGANVLGSVDIPNTLGSVDIPKNLIESIEIHASKTADGLVVISNIELTECISVNDKGVKKLKNHQFNLMPALLGENTSPVNNVNDIVWAQESRKTIVETLNAWNESIQANN
ncbi:MAG: hypothetical protein ACKOXC_08155 [Aquirufa sp.]